MCNIKTLCGPEVTALTPSPWLQGRQQAMRRMGGVICDVAYSANAALAIDVMQR